MNVTQKQKELLLRLLQENAELVRGRVDRKNESCKKLNTLWDKMAAQINAINEGPEKNGKEWAKTWKDIKVYILKKEAKRRSYTQGTGGGPPPKIPFSNFEEDVLRLLTPEAAGLENIPEGGIHINEINNINCVIEQINTENVEEAEDIEMRVEGEQNLEINIAGEIEEDENILPNQNSIPTRNTKRIAGNSMQQLSNAMLDIQREKLQLKIKEIELREETLKVQKKILCELKNIKSLLAISDTNSDI